MKKLILLLFISTIIIGCTDSYYEHINGKYDVESTRYYTQYYADSTNYVFIEKDTIHNTTLEIMQGSKKIEYEKAIPSVEIINNEGRKVWLLRTKNEYTYRLLGETKKLKK